MGIMQYLEQKAKREQELEEFKAKFELKPTIEKVEHTGEVRVLTSKEARALLKAMGKE